MVFLTPLLIVSSVYMGSNDKLQASSKTGYFAVLICLVILYIVFGIILG